LVQIRHVIFLHIPAPTVNDRAVQVESHGGDLIRLLGRILGLAACGLGVAFAVVMLASLALAPASETAHADAPTETPSEDAVPPSVRSADALVPDAISPHPGGRRMTGLARPARTDDRREAKASALRANPFAVSSAASWRAAGATTPSVMAATPSPGSHRAPLDSHGDFGPHRGAPAPTSLSTTSTPVGSLGGGGGPAEGGPSLTMAAVLSAALAAVLWLSQLLRAGEVRWRSTLLTLSIERPG
jgi:hypothetical protein